MDEIKQKIAFFASTEVFANSGYSQLSPNAAPPHNARP